MTGFLNFIFCQSISKSLNIHFDPSQNVLLIILLNGLMMVANEGSVAQRCSR